MVALCQKRGAPDARASVGFSYDCDASSRSGPAGSSRRKPNRRRNPPHSPRAIRSVAVDREVRRRQGGLMSLTEYQAGATFPGRIGRTIGDSDPAWPKPNRAEAGTPNIVYIVLDDTGYGQFGCYGSPISTPNLDRLAQNGLLYTNMHTTALCSPSRSCMLTGRNHHSNGMACITEGPPVFPAPMARSRSRTVSYRRCCCRTATRRTASASGI